MDNPQLSILDKYIDIRLVTRQHKSYLCIHKDESSSTIP
nr:MAG TPA: hypothetical protein [Crassvirales sp.]